MDMMEAFEKWADEQGMFIDGAGSKGYPSTKTQGAWEAWQRLYPMVECAYAEAFHTAAPNRTDGEECFMASTTKARLEGE